MVLEKGKGRVNGAMKNVKGIADQSIISAVLNKGVAYVPDAVINKAKRTVKNFSDENRRMVK